MYIEFSSSMAPSRYIFLNMTKWLNFVFSIEILEENLFLSQNLHLSSLQTSS